MWQPTRARPSPRHSAFARFFWKDVLYKARRMSLWRGLVVDRLPSHRQTRRRCARSEVEFTASHCRKQERTDQPTAPVGGRGTAEYEGDFAELLPFSIDAQWAGVGCQTVWGKGSFRALCLAPPRLMGPILDVKALRSCLIPQPHNRRRSNLRRRY